MRRALQGVATAAAALGAAVLAVGASAAGQRLAGAEGFYRARVLEPAAGYVAGKPVEVWCAAATSGWRAFVTAKLGAGTLANGWTVAGTSSIYLSADVCPPLRGALRGEPQYVPALAATIEAITHEAIHDRGELDEGVTDCDAMHEMPGVAVRFFHVKPGRPLRALMVAAWVYHREQPPEYLAVC